MRILDEAHGTDAVTRVLLDSSDGEREWGTIGVSENIIEASWEALVDSLEYAFQPRGDDAPRRVGCGRRWAARPTLRRSRSPDRRSALARRSWSLEVLRSGRLSLGPMGERFERAFADWLGVEDAVAVSSGTTALHLGVRALGWGPGDEVLTSPFSFVASANCLLYEGVRPVFCDVDPETLEPRPGCGRRLRWASAPRASCRSTSSATRRRWPELEALAAERGLGILEDACEALGAVDSEGRRVGARGNLATFAFYANKQLTTGEGGMIVSPDREVAARLRSERNQGRAADMGWLDHGGLGFNYRLSDLAAALGVAQLEKLDSMLAGRAAGRRPLRARASPGIEGLRPPIAGARRGAAQLVRLRRPAFPRAPTATRRSPASPSGASPARPTCPASTSSRTCASWATARASSRSPKRPRRARWRCPSSRR